MENFCEKGKLEKKNGYDVCRGVDQKGELRYDLTLLYPSAQTSGHYHFGDEPELYEVQSGQASFLIQSRDAQETYLIEAKEKEKVVVVPGFSMRTINSSASDNLIISNWVNDKVQNDYNAFKNIQEPINPVRNNPPMADADILKRNRISNGVKLRPKKIPAELENLDFLKNPEKYKNILTIENLYDRT